MIEPVSMFLTLVASAAGKKAVGETFALLRQLIGLEQDQVRMLKAIELNVEAMLQGPFHTGRRQLNDALSAWRQEADRDRFLHEARVSFTQALGQDRVALRRSFAALHLAAIWIALESPNDVRRYLEEAHFEALSAVLPAMGPRLRLDPRVLLDYNHGERARGLRATPVAHYANLLARTRQAWGATSDDAPLFIPPARNWGDVVPEKPVSHGRMDFSLFLPDQNARTAIRREQDIEPWLAKQNRAW